MKAKTKQSAFTLIELLVVIAIIGILATLVVIALQQARQNARDAKRVADVKQVSTALELYFNDNQAYPETLDELQVGGYMQQLPEAPSSADGTCSPEDNAYNYAVDSERGYYQLSFCTGKQVSDMSPGVMCMTPGGLSTNCSAMALAPDPNPFCDPSEAVTFTDGDSDGYLDVHTCCELGAIRNNPSADYELVNNIDCSNSENWVQDITYGGITSSYNGFTTIIDFSGDLNGNNYLIEGINLVKNSGTPIPYSGLLTVASGADVNISNINFNNALVNHTTGAEAAIIVPISNGNILTIDNCSVSNSNITASAGRSSAFVAYVASGKVDISNSYIDNLTTAISGYGFGSFVGDTQSNGTTNLNSITDSYLINSDITAISCGGLGGISRVANSMTIDNVYVKNVNFEHGSSAATGGFAYDGNMVNIKNSYVENSHISSNSVGSGFAFFSPDLSDSLIENVYVKDSTVENPSSGWNIAAIAGSASNTIFRDSYVDNFSITNVTASNVSGFIGRGSNIEIYNSYVDGLNIQSNAGEKVGGLVATFFGGDNIIVGSGVRDAQLLSNEEENSNLVSGLFGAPSSGSSVSVSCSYFIGDLENSYDEPMGGLTSSCPTGSTLYIDNVFVSANINNSSATYDRCLIGSNSIDGTVVAGEDNFYNSDICTYGTENLGSPLDTAQSNSLISSATNWEVDTPFCLAGGISCSSYTGGSECYYNGDTYGVVQIGDQTWFANNLNTSVYNDGLTDIEFNHDTWTSVVEANNDPAWSWPSDGVTVYQDYGKLYNSFAVETGNLCPTGWHVPTHDELTDLERATCNILGNSNCETTFPYDTTTVGWLGDNEGSALAGELSMWDSGALVSDPDFGESGFDALPLGRRYGAGNYNGFGEYAYVWSSTIYDQYYRWTRYMSDSLTEPTRNRDYKTTGFPVRCLKD